MYDINPFESSNHFTIILYAADGEAYTLDHISRMTSEETAALGITKESVQSAIEFYGINLIEEHLPADGINHLGFIISEDGVLLGK